MWKSSSPWPNLSLKHWHQPVSEAPPCALAFWQKVPPVQHRWVLSSGQTQGVRTRKLWDLQTMASTRVTALTACAEQWPLLQVPYSRKQCWSFSLVRIDSKWHWVRGYKIKMTSASLHDHSSSQSAHAHELHEQPLLNLSATLRDLTAWIVQHFTQEKGLLMILTCILQLWCLTQLLQSLRPEWG